MNLLQEKDIINNCLKLIAANTILCHVLKHPLTHFNKLNTFYCSRVVMAIINNFIKVQMIQLLA